MSTQEATKNADFPLGVPKPFITLTQIQRTYIDWKALGGWIVDDEAPTGIRKLLLNDLADQMGIPAQSLSQSCRNVPNFYDLVEERAKEFNSTSRLAYMRNRWFTSAATMKNWALSEAWFRNNDPTYKEAKAKVEVEAGTGLLDIFSKRKPAPIEGQVVDGKPDANA